MRTRILGGIAVVAALVAIAGMSIDSRTEVARDSEGPAASPAIAQGPLDGLVFVGKIGPADNPDLDDELHFNNGRFWSSNCMQCGFRPGAYWVRKVGDSIHFRGRLDSADRGVFRYRGTVSDGRIEIAINWTKNRWYWSIDKKLTFVGTLDAAKSAATAETVMRQIVAAQPSSLQCSRL